MPLLAQTFINAFLHGMGIALCIIIVIILAVIVAFSIRHRHHREDDELEDPLAEEKVFIPLAQPFMAAYTDADITQRVIDLMSSKPSPTEGQLIKACDYVTELLNRKTMTHGAAVQPNTEGEHPEVHVRREGNGVFLQPGDQ